MKKFLKILKWTGIVLVALIAILTVTVALRQNRRFDAPYPDIKASTDSAIIQRGKELVLGPANCASCHGPENVEEQLKKGEEVALLGGHKWDLPFGTIYARNITSDKVNGIGKYTDAEVARILRYGVHADGRAVLPFMPFQNMSDEDLTAIISYLRTQKPTAHKVPDHNFSVMGKVFKAFMVEPVGPSTPNVPKSVTRDTSAAYGRYLAINVADCNGCHTKRGMGGEELGPSFAGGEPFPSPGNLPPLAPPNISGDSASRLFHWTQDDFVARFRKGRQIEHSHMPWAAFSKFSDNDLKAIYNFLKSIRKGEGTPKVVLAKN